MGDNALQIIVEQPFDWLGSVVVPSAAILISAGIALGLFARERRAAQQGERNAVLARILELLHELSGVETDNLTDEQAKRIMRKLITSTNILELMLPRKDWPLPDFVSTVVIVGELHGREHLSATAGWLMHVVTGWERGEISSDALTAAMPIDVSQFHQKVDPAEWEWKTGSKPKPPSRTPKDFYNN